MHDQQPPSGAGASRGAGLTWWRVVIAIALGSALVGWGLYLGVPAFRRRVQYVPVRAHALLVEARRQRHPPTIPPPAPVTLTGFVTTPGSTPTALPNAPPAPTSVPVALPTSTAPLQARTRTPPPSLTPTPLPSPTPMSLLSATPMPTRARVTLDLSRIRHVYQDWNNCGPATLSMVLSFYGRDETQGDVRNAVRPNRWDLNVSPHELAAYVRSLGLKVLVREGGRSETIKRFLEHGIPAMLVLWYYPDEHGGGHYRMIVGYDERAGEWLAYDVQRGPEYRISYAQQDEEWQVFNRRYMIVHRAEQAPLVHRIVGEDMDDEAMYEHALEVALAERKADPENVFAWFNVGTNHTALGNHAEASAAYDQARILGLPFRMLWYQFGPFETYLALERYQDVIDLAMANLNMVGNQEESHYYLGRARQALAACRREKIAPQARSMID